MAKKRKLHLSLLNDLATQENLSVVEVDGKKVSNDTPTKYIDLAPIRKTTNSSTKTSTTNATKTNTTKNTKEQDSWFKSGAFSDGYDFGDVTKTILGTGTDLSQELSKGILNVAESALDLGTYGVAAVTDKLGNKDVAENIKQFGQKNLVDDLGLANRFANYGVLGMANNLVQGNWEAFNPLNVDVTGSDASFESSSVFGNKTEQLGQGVGYVLGMTGLQAAGVPWQVTAMSTSMGNEMTEAFDNNATYGQAFASGIMSGLVEMGSEYLFGGLGKVTGAGALDDLFAGNAGKLVSKLTNSKALKNVTETVIKAGGEGVEEVISGLGSAIGKKLTYMSDKEINEIYSSDQAFDDFINGALVSGVIQAPGVVQNTKQSRDYVSGYTQNEQAVIDSLVNEQTNEIAKNNALENELNKAIESKEMEQGGILSAKEKNALKEQIQAKIDSGEIDISSTKVSNKDISKIREAVEESMKKGLLDTNTIESVLGTGTDLSKDSYLQKSYIETAKRREAFTYENEITDAKEKAVYDSASKYFNNTTRSHEFVDRVAKIAKDKGTNYGFINNEELQSLGHDVEGKQVNGLVRTNKNGEQTVLINIDSPKALETIVGHETTHLLEGTQEYQDLQEAIFNYAKEKGDFNARQKSLNSLYEGIENANVDSELTADLVGDYLFTDTEFINNLSTEKPTLFQKIKELIDDLVVRFTGTKEEKALREVQKKFKEAYRQNAVQIDADTKYSISDKNIKDVSTGYNSDEYYYEMQYTQDGKVVGTVEYGEYKGKPNVKMIEVKPEYRRQGIATKLLQELQNKYPDQEIDFGMTTPDGTKLLNSITYEVENKEYVKTQKQLEKVTNRINEIETANVWNDDIDTEYYKLLDKQRKLDKKLFDLELDGNNKTSRFVKTDNTKYSLSEKGEMVDNKGNKVTLETTDTGTHGTLMAIHNLNESKFKSVLELGGFPVPSIAITKNVQEGFGDISVLFDKNTIDPSNKLNEVFDRDVWSPRVPRTVNKFASKIDNAATNLGLKSYELREYLENETIENATERLSREDKVIDKFLEDNNIQVEQVDNVYKSKEPRAIYNKVPEIQNFIRENDVTYQKLIEDSTLRQKFLDTLKAWARENYKNSPLKSKLVDGLPPYVVSLEEQINKDAENGGYEGELYVQSLNDDFENIKNPSQELDEYATKRAQEKAKDAKVEEYKTEFNKYIREQLETINEGKYFEKEGVDPYTDNGRKSFSQLHTKYTLENLVKAMKSRSTIAGESLGTPGFGEIQASMAKKFKSIDDIKANENQIIPKEQEGKIHEATRDIIWGDLEEIAKGYKYYNPDADSFDYNNQYAVDNASQALFDLANSKKINIEQFKKLLNENLIDSNKIPETMLQKTIDDLNDLKNMPTEYFEAKPQRAVGLNEVQVVVIPNTSNAEFKQQLQDAGLRYYEYNPNIEGDKQRVINQFDDLKFSLSQQNEAAPTKNPNLTYSEDIKLQVEEAIAPLQEQINELTEQITNNTTDNVKVPENPIMEELAPITEVEYTQPTKAELDNLMALQETGGTEYANTFFGLRDKYGQRNLYKGINEYNKAPDTYEAPIKGDEFAPIPQNIVEQQGQEAFNNIDESNMPGEAEDTTPDTETEMTASESLFETRSYEDVGNRKVNAYQYDNPEVKPYFQEAALQMLYDLDNSIKGERMYNDEAYYNSNGEVGWYGTTRQTTDDIAELLDGVDGKYKLSYENIRKGLNAIIKDEGSENNAASKRIEFYLDQRLREGYTSVDGYEIPANQEYIDMMNTQATNGEDVADYYNNIPITDDIAPNVSNSESIAPVKEQYEAIRPEPEPRMIRVKEPQKLGKVEGRVTKPTEPELINGAKQQTLEGTEEDLYTKTKKELRRDLIEPNKDFLISALDNAKNRSMALMNNTDTIRNTELVFGREAGRMINETIFQKELDNEADSIAWQNQERQEIKDLGIKARSKESAAVQKYGEKQWVNEAGEVLKYGDAELAAEFEDIDTQERIKYAAQAIRNKYDNYIDAANNVLTKLGFEPIKKRNDYMRHFQELNDVFTRYGIPFNAQNMQEHVLPTDINGLTEFWSPQKNYFANMQPRKGIKTTYDAITGIDGYISGISNLIFHTEDIQRGRAFEELIRETYGESKGWENLDKLPNELKQARAEKIQDNHLSNYAAWLHEWTNNIAGKKNKIDRSIESMFGRKAFSFLDNVRKQVGSNMVGGNISSAGTNFISSFQALAKTNKLAFAKGTADTIKNIFIKDNFIDNNKFLTSRMGTDMISKNAWQKIQDAGYVFMKGSDWFTSNQIVRSKYYELLAKGMDEQQAHAEAGQFAARIMSDRTKGAAPLIYNSKMLGMVTQFQQEVNNQLYSTFYDTYQESKENAEGNALRTAAGMTFTLGQLFAFTHLFGKTFESIAGYNPTFDVIEIIKTAFGWGDEDEEKTTSERLKEAADMLVDALPYVNILTGGGRIPIASGIPNLVGVATGGTDEYGNELTLGDEMKKLLYLIPPTGGNQIKKTYQGLSMFDDDLPVSGSYTDSGNLRFPVEDTLGNKVQAALFGQYASKNASQYFDEERMPLKENQIQEYAELDMSIADYWKYRDGLKEQNTLEEKFEYVNDLDVTDKQKNIMINNIVDREEKVDMSNYDDFGSYEEFDFAIKNEEKYNFLQENNISYSDYIANEHSKEAYNWAYSNPEKYAVSKAVTDNVVRYKQYKSEIYDIEADKDEDGDSIRGSRKEKVISYVNSLNLSIPQKAMLIKQEYSTFNDYNTQIVEYVSELDVSYEEKKTILQELDMTVHDDGTVTWE